MTLYIVLSSNQAFISIHTYPVISLSFSFSKGFLNHLHILPSRKTSLPILQDVSGIIKPRRWDYIYFVMFINYTFQTAHLPSCSSNSRRMTLLLGPPSSGKTTLLLALAGKLSKDLKVRKLNVRWIYFILGKIIWIRIVGLILSVLLYVPSIVTCHKSFFFFFFFLLIMIFFFW